ncbi:MAG: radical SAM protein, partial [Bacteroidota bacterium]
DLQTTDVLREIRKRVPEYTPCAYINGTEEPDSFKWLLAGRIGTREQIYGYVGPNFLEVIQTVHHFWTGRYLAYSRPSMTSLGRSMLLLAPLDTGLRRIASSYAASVLARPLHAFKGLHFQSIMVIQPVDILPDGGQNMCDGCPDMTLWNGRLVWSCRMEELKHFGCWVQTVPKA